MEHPPNVTETRQEVVTPGVAPVPAVPATTGERVIEDPATGAVVREPYGPRTAYATAPAVAVNRTSVVSVDPGFRAMQLVWLLGGITEAILGFRVVLKALAANPDAGFVSFIYALSAPLAAPFRNITSDYGLSNNGVLEIGSLIAMAVYLLATYIVVKIVRIATTPRTTTTV